MTTGRLLPGATETTDGAVVSLSGGMDSCVALSWAVQKWGRDKVRAVGFDYGQRHALELAHAQAVADYEEVPYEIIELPKIFTGAGSSLMSDQEVEVVGSYEELAARKHGQPTIVPGRNLNFLAMCATYAETHKLNHIVIANHAGDSGNWHYFDCSPEFIAGASVAIAVGTGFAVQLLAPFTQMTKGEIVSMGAQLGAPLGLTLSCYNGEEPACGKCATCIERLHAFEEAGYVDPITYTLGANQTGLRHFPLAIR